MALWAYNPLTNRLPMNWELKPTRQLVVGFRVITKTYCLDMAILFVQIYFSTVSIHFDDVMIA